ncbi:hypothetical protein H8356DRAFT_1416617 [Neocallimastix lanati (nom. inval.)]|nr:hypothetical protein H8356DRAFT_1416617 [Neocallimastix sp. JGI-2020a]
MDYSPDIVDKVANKLSPYSQKISIEALKNFVSAKSSLKDKCELLHSIDVVVNGEDDSSFSMLSYDFNSGWIHSGNNFGLLIFTDYYDNYVAQFFLAAIVIFKHKVINNPLLIQYALENLRLSIVNGKVCISQMLGESSSEVLSDKINKCSIVVKVACVGSQRVAILLSSCKSQDFLERHGYYLWLSHQHDDKTSFIIKKGKRAELLWPEITNFQKFQFIEKSVFIREEKYREKSQGFCIYNKGYLYEVLVQICVFRYIKRGISIDEINKLLFIPERNLEIKEFGDIIIIYDLFLKRGFSDYLKEISRYIKELMLIIGVNINIPKGYRSDLLFTFNHAKIWPYCSYPNSTISDTSPSIIDPVELLLEMLQRLQQQN